MLNTRNKASKRNCKKPNKKRRSWFSLGKPRGVTDAQALSAEKKIKKHIPDAKNMTDVLVGIAEKEAWIEKVERTHALRTQQDTYRQRTEAENRHRFHEMRLSENTREHNSKQAKKGLADASKQPKLTIA